MSQTYAFHKIVNLGAHLTSSAVGVSALYNLSQGRYAKAVADGVIVGLTEFIAYMIRQERNVRERMDEESGTWQKEREVQQKSWHEEDKQGAFERGYWRGISDQHTEYFNRAMESLDRTINDFEKVLIRKRWEKGFTSADYLPVEPSKRKARDISDLIPRFSYR